MKSTLGSSFFIQTLDKYSVTSIIRQINADTLERRSCWQMMRLGEGKKKKEKEEEKEIGRGKEKKVEKKKKKKRLGEERKKGRRKKRRKRDWARERKKVEKKKKKKRLGEVAGRFTNPSCGAAAALITGATGATENSPPS